MEEKYISLVFEGDKFILPVYFLGDEELNWYLLREDLETLFNFEGIVSFCFLSYKESSVCV
jgi:hypothetical protein